MATVGVSASIDRGLRTLYPGYFALVMATGIISNAFYYLGPRALSDVLLAVNLAAYPILLAATFARALRYPRELWADLVNPRLVFTFFTIVAGSDVLGLGLALRGFDEVAIVLWFAALVLWVLLIYLSFSVMTFLSAGTGAEVVHGGWLIAIVGTESLVLLGIQIAGRLGGLESTVFVASYMLWGIGLVLYGMFVTLFAYRIFFLKVTAADLNPLWWVIMGAAAISANAGSMLILTPTPVEFLESMHPFIDGTTLILWAWGTWWIPLLVIIELWRHLVWRDPLRYVPTYWSLVFPLGMYTLATYRLGLAGDFPPLRTAPDVLIWIAFGAWALTMSGLLRSLVSPGPERSIGLG